MFQGNQWNERNQQSTSTAYQTFSYELVLQKIDIPSRLPLVTPAENAARIAKGVP
jgi:hypothetical protein